MHSDQPSAADSPLDVADDIDPSRHDSVAHYLVAALTIRRKFFCSDAARYRDTGTIAFRTRLCSISVHAEAPLHLRAQQRSAMIGIGIWRGSRYRSFSMNYRSLALAIAALSSAHITTAAAQSVYVAPGGVYIGSGPV